MYRKDIRHPRRCPSRPHKPAGRGATRRRAADQTLLSPKYFNQPRIINHVKPPTPSGTMPTSKFLPSHGNTMTSSCAIRLNAPLAKIQPACKPIGSQSERVCIRASARIKPTRKSVVKLAITNIGSANCANECAIELNPEVHVTSVD